MAPNEEEFDLLQRQMKARLSDGQGETIYEIGLGGILLHAQYSTCVRTPYYVNVCVQCL